MVGSGRNGANLHAVLITTGTDPEDFVRFQNGTTSKAAKLKHPAKLKEAGLIKIITHLSTGYTWEKGFYYESWRKYYEKKKVKMG